MKKNISIQIYSSDLEEFREYLYERENSQATIKKYLSDFKIFCEFLGEETNIYKGTLLSYKEWLVAHYAISSVNSMLVSLNQYLTYKDAPGLKIKRIKVQKQLFIKEEKALTKAEYFRLIDTARKKKKEQLALIIETIGATGIRISELSGFTLEQIRKGRVEIYNKGKNRIILIPSQLKKKLLRYADSQKIRNGCLFITRNGKPKDRSNLWAEMKKLHADAGVADRKSVV